MIICKRILTIRQSNNDYKETLTFYLKDESNFCGGGWFSLDGIDKNGVKKFHFQDKSRTVVEQLFEELVASSEQSL